MNELYKGFKYYSRSYFDTSHLYKYNEKTKQFFWMDHCWTGEGQWVLRKDFSAFNLVEISEERAQEIAKGTLFTAPHYYT